MTIQLKDSIFIAGVHQAAGTSLTLGADVEAELVNRGVAVYVGDDPTEGGLVPATFTKDANNNLALAVAGGASRRLPIPSINTIMFLGDSFTLRNFHVGTISGYSFSGTQMTLSFSAAPQVVVGSSVWLHSRNLRGTANQPLEGAWPVVSWSGSDVTVELGFDGTGLNPGTGSVAFTCAYSDCGRALGAASILALQNKPITPIIRGIGGDLISDLRERLAWHMAAVPPSVAPTINILIGINDCEAGVAINDMIADYDYIIETLLAGGYRVILSTVWPLGATHASYATATPLIKQLNGYLRNKAASTSGVLLSEEFNAIRDGANDYALPANLAADKIHPAPPGALLGGAALATAISGDLNTVSMDMVSSALDGYDVTPTGWNKLKNPLFSGTGGTVGTGVTGPVADFWTVNSSGGTSCTVTYPAHSSGIGNDMQIEHNRSGATQNFSAEQDVTAQCPAGSATSVGCEVEVVADSGGHYLLVYASITSPRGEERIVARRNGQSYANNGRLPASGTRYWFETPIIAIPADATAVKWKALCVGGAIGVTTVKFGRPVVR